MALEPMAQHGCRTLMVAANFNSKRATEGTMLRQEHLAEKWVATLSFEGRRWMEWIDFKFVLYLTTLSLQPVRFVLCRTNSINFASASLSSYLTNDQQSLSMSVSQGSLQQLTSM